MKILIVRLGAIGDVIHVLPALSALRRAHPQAYISWAVESGATATLLSDNPLLDEVIVLDNRKWRRSPGQAATRNEIRTLVRGLRESRYDVSLDFQGLLKSAVIPFLARIPRRIGFAFEALREPASGFLLTERVSVSNDEHVIRKNLELAASMGAPTDLEYEFPLHAAETDRQYITSQLSEIGEHPALVNPGGGWSTKLWSPERFAEVARRLWKHFGIPSVITYGPGEESLAEQVVARCRNEPVRHLKTSLRQFLVLARDARIFVGGDTGPMHLAAAVGTPIVSIFGPTSSRRNGPFSRDDIVVERDDLECRVDCYRRKCQHTSCMDLPTEVVWRAVVERLGRSAVEGTDPLDASQLWWHTVEAGLREND
jgi:lipopolysaccharide heptosyltransferase I